VDIRLDSSRKISLKGFLLEQNVPLYRSDEKVTGKIIVKSPPNRTVTHYGITVELESSIQFYESLNSVSVSPVSEAACVDVSKDGAITGEVEVPFELDLSKCKGKDGQPVLESYDGEKFDVRHTLVVTLKRPWYTFNVTRVASIAIQHIAPAPPTDAEARLVPTQLAIVPRVPTIEVDDCGGKCTFNYGRAHWNIGDTLTGTIAFSELEKPVTLLKLVLYKIEVADGDTQEKTVKELVIITPTPSAALPPPAPPAPTATGEAAVAPAAVAAPPVADSKLANVRTDPVKSGEMIPVAFVLVADESEGVALGPTYDELNDSENPVNVHHYLRLYMEDVDGKKAWNTHEIILYRSKLAGLSAVEV
jgi:hypothetical protein